MRGFVTDVAHFARDLVYAPVGETDTSTATFGGAGHERAVEGGQLAAVMTSEPSDCQQYVDIKQAGLHRRGSRPLFLQ